MSLAWLKADVLLGSIGKFAAASLLFATLGISGCGTDPVKSGVAKVCTLNSDCNGGLVCSFGLCHKACSVTTDCPSNQRCVQTQDTNVCQLTQEAQCHFNSDCAEPLVCAIDRQCRNQCNADTDCLDKQTCADHVCAEPREVTDTGTLVGAVGGAGGEGNTSGGGSAPVGGANSAGEGGMPPVTCTPGADCVPEGMPCQLGTVTCDNDVAGCMVTTDADDGTECDTDKVCSAGVCTDCKVGDTCLPDPNNVCVTGTMSCASGPSCDAAKNVKAGTKCDTDKVCAGGDCVACVPNDPCDPPGQLCKNGKMACASGPVCTPTTTKAAGTTCDTDKVCDSAATCTACVQGGACSPSGNDCHKGTQDCATGPNCVDTLLPADDGLECAGNATFNFCTGGVCEACLNGNPCIPAGDLCHKGTLNCATTPPTCTASQTNATDGLACGDSMSCISGACLTNDRVLTVTSGAVADTAIDNSFTSVTVHLVDGTNKAVQGAVVTVLPTPGAYAVASAATNASGNAQISGRVGRAIGKYTFTVSAPGATSIQFDVNAVATAAKNIFTVVNTAHLSGYPADVGPGTMQELYYDVRAVTSAVDGTLYLADYCAVYSLSPAGVMTRIAGGANGVCGGAATDTGAGTSVKLYNVEALALDETHGFLYIADQGNLLVRQLELASGNILTYAGSSAANAKPWGDGGPADSAFVNPYGLAVATNGDLYIGDATSGSIRKVDYGTSVITTPIQGTGNYGGTCTAAGPLKLYSCGSEGDPCSIAWDKAGKMFISGYMCGLGNGGFRAVARVENDGSLSLVAGAGGAAAPAEGGAATSASFTYSPFLAFDKGGNLFLTTHYDQRVRRIDSLTTKITTVAGTGTAGTSSGDYAAGNLAVVSSPNSISFDGAGNLYFVDQGNYQVRTVYGIGSTTAQTGTLATVSGGGQTVKRDAAFGALLVKLTDGANAAISGVNVQWKRDETGSGLGATGDVTLTAKTNASGNAAMTGRVGLATGNYHFEASYSDIHGTAVSGSPQSFTVASTDPAAGDIFPVVNYVHTSGLGGYPGPATFAKMQSYSLGVVAASDGTIYASDQCAIYTIDSRGELSVFAGTPGSCSYAGDSGPALGAKLYDPEGMALDETNGVLYFADAGNSVIRMVDLSTGVIDTFAGGGAANTAPYGDGGQAVNANIGSPQSLAIAPDGKVYFPDSAHYYYRVVDPATGVISKWFTPTYPGSSCAAGTPSLYYPTVNSAIRFKANGDAYLSGYICQGTDTGTTYGILMRAASNGAMTRIAGLSTGTTTENILAVNASIPADMTDLQIDGNGDLVLAFTASHKLHKIDMTTGKISTIVGDGTAGYSLPSDSSAEPGAYVAATGVRLYNPFKLGLWPGGHVLIADESNYVTRMIW